MAGTTKQEFVYNTIRQRIFSGEYAPGAQLTEEQLCEDLGVSRTPVREAIRRLTSEALLETTPGIGLCVSRLRLEDLIEIYEMREGLERMAVQLFMLKAAPDDVQRLNESLYCQEEALNHCDYAEFMRHDMEFHHVLYRGARNHRLTAALDSIYDQIGRLAVSGQDDMALCRLAIDHHRTLYEAIVNGNTGLALHITVEHIRKLKRFYLKKYYNI